MYYLEDIVIGAKRETGRHTFTADEIKTFAKAYDPQRFHVDEKEAENSHFGALCASGWHTAAFCMRFLVEDRKRMVAEAKAAGVKIAQWGPSPGVRELKWIKPVYVGDTITYHTEALETRPSGSRPGWGLLTVRHTGTNQHGDIVYSVIGSAFVERRPGA
ncbi:bifunctional aldehyde dehydrogenase/enoyl-CoA hydratase [Variibacter gotjawalensis]|uniref:Bifunctional aldehyde dehydrogenase/enoyl-CoA hydratase n=1 Tax=Variibacter gotjawalensis TaxID=1333996 RepID=A0A0S3PTL3_9BRAD|nr:MaoC family dehydratase [Variibacter gotjawalensis]RZS51387.1 acyl dehydratase [Variibacter gotjawalensis]BAT59220.1 bifunctional aldehyde dehydrogenase/enoyl-CoA hydratase [Variibacter gotjawalensis]